MNNFVGRKNYYESDGKIKHNISGTSICFYIHRLGGNWFS